MPFFCLKATQLHQILALSLGIQTLREDLMWLPLRSLTLSTRNAKVLQLKVSFAQLLLSVWSTERTVHWLQPSWGQLHTAGNQRQCKRPPTKYKNLSGQKRQKSGFLFNWYSQMPKNRTVIMVCANSSCGNWCEEGVQGALSCCLRLYRNARTSTMVFAKRPTAGSLSMADVPISHLPNTSAKTVTSQ